MIPRVLGRLIRREAGVEGLRELGPGAEIMVEQGQAVSPETVIGSSKTGSRVVRLPLNENELALSMILKRSGESVRRGEPLLRRAGMFGLANTEYVCPVDGYVEEILVEQRAVLIREHTAEVRAGVAGLVTEVLPERGVRLSFDGTVMRFLAGWGPPVAGLLTPGADLFSPSDIGRVINETHRGRIIWAHSTLCAEAIVEAARVEAAGLIAGSVSLLELQRATAEIRQRTGRARLPLTLLISEGFGSAAMSSAYRQYLSSAVGRTVYLDAAERAELAWTSDPEIAFSPAAGAAAAGGPVAAPVQLGFELGGPPAGTPVRLVDLDLFGRTGVTRGAPAPHHLETGVSVVAVEVVLDDGLPVVVPLANLEVIGGAELR